MSKNEFMSELGARERKKKEKKHGDERCLLLLRVDVMKLILEGRHYPEWRIALNAVYAMPVAVGSAACRETPDHV
jgi:hypothetical protein